MRTAADMGSPGVPQEEFTLEEVQDFLSKSCEAMEAAHQPHQTAIEELERCYHMRSSWELRLMRAIWRIEELGTHEQMGFESVEEFFCAHFGRGFFRSCELVGVALALRDLPRLRAAFAEGRLSYDHLRALYEIADGENEAELAELAEGLSVSETFRVVRERKKLTAESSAEARSRRWLEKKWDQDLRMLHVKAQLPEDKGALFEAAIDALAARMPEDPLIEVGPTPMGMKRADALCELASGYLAQGGYLARGSSPISQMVVHVPLSVLQEGEGNARIEGGPAVCIETVQRLMCDSSVQGVVENSDGKPIGFGRARRTAPPKMKRELIARDRTCRWPACSRSSVVEAHHVDEWEAEGGETNYDEMVVFCPYHHWLVHEGGFKVAGIPPKIEILPPGQSLPPIKTGPPPIRDEVRREFEEELEKARGPTSVD